MLLLVIGRTSKTIKWSKTHTGPIIQKLFTILRDPDLINVTITGV